MWQNFEQTALVLRRSLSSLADNFGWVLSSRRWLAGWGALYISRVRDEQRDQLTAVTERSRGANTYSLVLPW